MARGEHIETSYRRWWLGKRIRVTRHGGDFLLCTGVKFWGPPSGVYGFVELTFDGGKKMNISPPNGVFKPRKSDMEVEGEVNAKLIGPAS